ncbi:hypothetical protein GWI33_009045 [Rhynchophorus ferrugineus]|uniref:Uncharacterized protein n=1 Tax=Rhynchophorus ferrugineus TaxID=354439 RepID=A0A834IHC8_RHYFE|nr:hypothetical protein GWI33_009045 [Rhynchophorus ferrugineus]
MTPCVVCQNEIQINQKDLFIILSLDRSNSVILETKRDSAIVFPRHDSRTYTHADPEHTSGKRRKPPGLPHLSNTPVGPKHIIALSTNPAQPPQQHPAGRNPLTSSSIGSIRVSDEAAEAGGGGGTAGGRLVAPGGGGPRRPLPENPVPDGSSPPFPSSPRRPLFVAATAAATASVGTVCMHLGIDQESCAPIRTVRRWWNLYPHTSRSQQLPNPQSRLEAANNKDASPERRGNRDTRDRA